MTPKPKTTAPPNDSATARAPWRPLPTQRTWVFTAVAMTFLVSVIVALYGRSIHAPFIYDDEDIILKNPSIERLWPLFGDAERRGPLNPVPQISTAGRPLVNYSLAMNYYFGKRNPAGYHAFNIFLHILSTLLLLSIMRRTLRLDFFAPEIRSAADALALIVALVWALHPLHTESVVYVTQRTELSVSLFYLATLYASLRYWTVATSRERTIWGVVAMLACTLGMTCKEVMATAPVAMLLFERTFLAGSFRAALTRSWRLYLGFVVAWGVLLLINYNGPRSGSAGFNTGVSAYAWWLTQTQILLLYLKLFVWPWPLVIFYEFPYLTSIKSAWPWLVPVAVLVVATLVLVARRTAVGFALAWMFLILSPTLLVPIKTEMAAERRMYLATAALVAAVVVGGYALVTRFVSSRPGTASERLSLAMISGAALLLVVVYATLDWRRVGTYLDPIELWQDAARYQPQNSTIQTNWGVSLAAVGRTAEAIDHYQEALRIDPDTREARPNLAEAHYDLGLKLLDQGKPAAAIEYFHTALEIMPDFPNAHYGMATALLAQQNLPMAAAHFQLAAQQRPDYVAALVNLGIVRINLNEIPGATTAFADAVRYAPDNADAHMGLAMALARQGNTQQAAEQYQAAFRADPRRADAHFELANLYVAAQDLPRAADEYQAAIRLQPDYVAAWQNLGAVSLSLGNVPQGIKQFAEALRLQPDNPQARANLEQALELQRQQQGK